MSELVALKKADLHNHLDGSVRPETAYALSVEQGIHIGTLEELRELMVNDENVQSLEEFLIPYATVLK